jgi:hypothetical protein
LAVAQELKNLYSYSIFRIPLRVNDLSTGASSTGGEFGSLVSGAIRRAFR